MKNLILITSLFLASLSGFAQIQLAKGDTAGTLQANRVNIDLSSDGRVGQKGSTGNLEKFALLREVVAATGGAINTINGKTGPTVTLVTNDIAESVNLYYTTARARAAVGGTGPIAYNSTTGIFSFSGSSADVGLGNVDNTSDANKPVSNATGTALSGKEPTITAGTTSQYWKGNKTWATLDKTAVGLGNVDNTTDATKPVSGAQQIALNLKADLASTIFRVNVATYAALTALSVPASSTYLVQVASDESQSSPYNTNQFYLKDNTGLTFKLILSKQ